MDDNLVIVILILIYGMTNSAEKNLNGQQQSGGLSKLSNDGNLFYQ